MLNMSQMYAGFSNSPSSLCLVLCPSLADVPRGSGAARRSGRCGASAVPVPRSPAGSGRVPCLSAPPASWCRRTAALPGWPDGSARRLLRLSQARRPLAGSQDPSSRSRSPPPLADGTTPRALFCARAATQCRRRKRKVAPDPERASCGAESRYQVVAREPASAGRRGIVWSAPDAGPRQGGVVSRTAAE